MTRVAAIDCGTNSVRLLVADIVDGRLTDVVRTTTIVRLGQGVDATGRLADAAIERTRVALDSYAALITQASAGVVRMVATSATRDARNTGQFTEMVQRTLGITPQVVAGDLEARLSFEGATRGLPLDGEVLVCDIGGGSTECVLGVAGHPPTASRSVDVGCVRLTERHVRHDPPSAAEVAAIRADADAALQQVAASVPLGPGPTLVGVAGTVTTVTALALGLRSYDSERIHGATVNAAAVRRVVERLVTADRATRASWGPVHPGRLDVLAAGGLVLLAVLEATGVDRVVASERDILDGIAWSCVAGPGSVG